MQKRMGLKCKRYCYPLSNKMKYVILRFTVWLFPPPAFWCLGYSLNN